MCVWGGGDGRWGGRGKGRGSVWGGDGEGEGGERTRERGGLCEGEGRPRGGGGTEGGGRPWMAWSHAECAHLLCSLQMGL